MTATISMDPRIEARREQVKAELDQRRWRRLALFGAIVLVVVAAVGALRSPLLDVEEVSVAGAQQTPVRTIVEASGISPGTSLVDVDLDAARAAIAALPWVDEVTSTRAWSGAISFEVTERTAVAQAEIDGTVIVIDGEGRVLETSAELDPSMVAVTGASGSTVPGGWLSSSSLEALEVAAAIDPELARRVASVSVAADGTLDLDLEGNGRVRFGTAVDLDAKLIALRTMVGQVDLGCLDVLDLQVPTVPVLTRRVPCS